MLSLEEALFQALEEERRLSEERALLPGLLQHDLANVLCQVSLSLSVLSAVTAEADRARCLRAIQGGVKRMGELLTGMRFLFLTRSGAADYGPGDLSAFITEIVNAPGVWPAGAPVALELPPSMNCSFSPTLVRHALVNLVGNAVAYSQGTWVRVRLSRVRGGLWQLSVANGGPGVPADHLPYLFELAQPVKYTSKDGSCGLGLYIARMCVRFQGSALRVRTRSALTVFSFNVRVAERDQPAREVPAGNFYAA